VIVAAMAACAAHAQGWWEKVTVKGDVRYRVETIADDSKKDADGDTYTRLRDRFRARLGVEGKANDYLKGGIELSTGQSDPVSGNQTFGDVFNKKDFKVNRAYLDLSAFSDPSPFELHAIGGKMKHPFINVSDLIWDSDLTPEGLGLSGSVNPGPVTVSGNAAYLWVQERSDRDDAMLLGAQGAVKVQPIPELYVMAGATYYGYQNVEGYDVFDWEAKNSKYGNSTEDGTVSGSVTNQIYKYGYTPIEVFGEIGAWVLRVPVSLYSQFVVNPEADDNELGYLLGVSVGKAKNPHTWEVGYRYCELQKDAVVGAFTDSDRWGGGTDGRGHKVYGRYQLMQNLQAGITYFRDEKKISDSAKKTDYDRVQIDLIAAF
jgi:hypothetical protein